MDPVPQLIAEWRDFYAAVASVGATLVGLLDKDSYWWAAPGAAEQGQGWFPSGSQWSKMW
jgi:hypothetical protein